MHILISPYTTSFFLPGGLNAKGKRHTKIVLKSVTGRDEELLATLGTKKISEAITLLLQRCIEQIGTITKITDITINSLLIADRDLIVIKLYELVQGSNIQITSFCKNDECGKPIDIDFNLDQIPIDYKNMRNGLFSMQFEDELQFHNGYKKSIREIKFRLPTIGDLQIISYITDKKRAIDVLLARCIIVMDDKTKIDKSVISLLSENSKNKIEENIKNSSPKVDLEMYIKCPECAYSFTMFFNVFQSFLNTLTMDLDDLYENVHFLAYYYHWSENEILQMPISKRRKYTHILKDNIENTEFQ